MKTEISEFKGHPLIKLLGEAKTNEKGETNHYPIVMFGVRKAKLVLEHVDDIRKFVESQEAQKEGGQ